MAQKYLFKYNDMVDEIDGFILSTGNITQKMRQDGGSHGSYISDPTARSAISLMEPPDDIARYIRWTHAIEAAMERIVYEDLVNQKYGNVRKGMQYIVKHYFLEPRPPEYNAHARDQIIDYCKISISTFYARIERISDIVLEEYDKLK